MRLPLVTLALLTALPTFAQETQGHWDLDVHRFTPSISGHFNGSSDGNPFDVDLQNDLALARETTKPGFGLEYQGPRFGLELSWDEQDYKGQSLLSRNIEINGVQYAADTPVTSTFKAANTTLNWTIRCFTTQQFWLGLDLGARATAAEINVSGLVPNTNQTTSVDYKTTLPVPQVGPSLGFNALDGKVVVRAMYHFISYKGCTYSHSGADLRYFPISWLGVRFFADSEHIRVPQGSIKSDLDVTLDRSGTGVGLVARF
jgi:hypothetical protein